jgi:hypothetical protein
MWTYRKIRNKPFFIIYNRSSQIHRIINNEQDARDYVNKCNTSGAPHTRLYNASTRQFTESISDTKKRELAKHIRDYSIAELETDYAKLCEIGCNAATQSVYVKTGNKVVDQYTFVERLNTISRNRLSFFEFWENLDYFKNKPNIKKLLTNLAETRQYESEYVRLYNVYRLYYGAVNIFRPILAMEYYCMYQPKTILDFTMGWGGRLVGACALNIHKYIGIDSNIRLEQPYNQLKSFLEPRTTTQIELHFKNALEIDYSKLDYDMVFTSPPYYNTEKYQHSIIYQATQDWDELFYYPLFYLTHKYLKKGGVYCLNISVEIYTRVCVPLFGEATHVYPMKKHSRHNKKTDDKKHMHTEHVYIWRK